MALLTTRRRLLFQTLAATSPILPIRAEEAAPGPAEGKPQYSAATRPKIGLTEMMTRVTTKIEIYDEHWNGSIGTCFQFTFFESQGTGLHALVTDKHVIMPEPNYVPKSAFITVTLATSDNKPDYGRELRLEIPRLAEKWIPHPNPTIDLAIIPVNEIMASQANIGQPIFQVNLNQVHIPSDDEIKRLSAIEDLIIIGYPIGISDEVNNVPVIRRGTTATPPFLDFNGNRDFLVDAPIFEGSSGSPVFLFRRGAWVDDLTNQPKIGTDMRLLGVIWGNITQNVTAKKRDFTPIPTQLRDDYVTQVPTNLGIAVKSQQILEFEPVLMKLGVKPPKDYVVRASLTGGPP